jgi:hypothetical protein
MNLEKRSASGAELAQPTEETHRGDTDPRDREGKVIAGPPLDPQSKAGAPGRHETALFDAPETGRWRERWTEIQVGFVDEPRRAVKEADGLVAEVVKRLSEVFANERTGLERQWDRGDEVTTEDLRVALQGYRSFFDRLLAV